MTFPITYNRFDAFGRIILSAAPSAVSGYDDQYADLVHFVDGNAEFLRDNAGLLTISTVYSPDSGPEGFFASSALRNGELGNDIPQWAGTYSTNSVGGKTYYHLASETVFRNADGTGNQTTSYAYAFHAGTNAVKTMTTTLPVVSSGQNGSGVASTSNVAFDIDGRLVWMKDAAGTISFMQYDPATGGLVKTIADVDTDLAGSLTPSLPSGWSNPSGLHLMTNFVVDQYGRTTQETGPDGKVTYTVYNDADREVRVYGGWSGNASILPTVVYRENWFDGYTETFTMSSAPSGGNQPTGNESLSGIQSLTRSLLNAAGQVVTVNQYFNLSGLSYSNTTMGNVGVHFDTTSYAFDQRGRLSKTVSPSGTIYRTNFDGLGRTVSEWVGTDDVPSSGYWPNTTGTDMVKVAEYEYDGGEVGDSLLTMITRYSGNTTLAPNQVTQYAQDWRGRVIGMKQGVEASEATDVNRPITLFDYDNLNQVTRTRVYDGDNANLTDANSTLQVPSSSLLRAQTRLSFDDLGRVYMTDIDHVNPANGTIGNDSLTSQTWYDERGLVRKQVAPGGPVVKSAYDSLGRLSVQYITDGQGDSNYTQALSVSDDIVLEQTESIYNDAGRVVQTINRQRFHDATGNGPLGNASGNQPKARVYNVGYYYDIAGRTTDVVNVGTNGNATWTLPGNAPARSDTVLRTSYGYGSNGMVANVTDPKGIVTRTTHDAMGRTLTTVEDSGGANKTVVYTYGNAGMTSLTAVNASTGNQTTEWVYGVTVAGGSGLNSNDIVGETWHPNPANGTANSTLKDTVKVSALGQTLEATDRNGTTHQYFHDALGRLTIDKVTVLGNGVDGGSRRQEFGYDTFGQLLSARQYSQSEIQCWSVVVSWKSVSMIWPNLFVYTTLELPSGNVSVVFMAQ